MSTKIDNKYKEIRCIEVELSNTKYKDPSIEDGKTKSIIIKTNNLVSILYIDYTDLKDVYKVVRGRINNICNTVTTRSNNCVVLPYPLENTIFPAGNINDICIEIDDSKEYNKSVKNIQLSTILDINSFDYEYVIEDDKPDPIPKPEEWETNEAGDETTVHGYLPYTTD